MYLGYSYDAASSILHKTFSKPHACLKFFWNAAEGAHIA
jgi:hypothetical protein